MAYTPESLEAAYEKYDDMIKQAIFDGTIHQTMTDNNDGLTSLLKFQLTAAGEFRNVIDVPRYLSVFLARYTADVGNDFIERERRFIKKWERKYGKQAVRPKAVTDLSTFQGVSGSSKDVSTAEKAAAKEAELLKAAAEKAAAKKAAAEKAAAEKAAAERAAARKAAEEKAAAERAAEEKAAAERAVEEKAAADEAAAAAIHSALKEEAAKKEAAKKAAIRKAATTKAAAEKAAMMEEAAAKAAEEAAAAMAAAEKAANEKAAARIAATERLSNKRTTTEHATAFTKATPGNKNLHKKAPARPQPSTRDAPTAGPSNNQNGVIRVKHRAPTFQELDDDSDDAFNSRKRRYQSQSSEESDNNRNGAGKNRQNTNRRMAHPIGEDFDPPCTQCVKRRLRCEKDKYAAACIRCYIGKNRCDYGGRYFQKPNLYKKGRGRGKGKDKGVAKIEKEDVESEDEIDDRRRPVKRIRSSQYVEDDDQMMISGYETSQQPPLSRSPSPKPRREAAKRAAVALAATVRFVNYEENRLRKQEEKFPKKSRPLDTTDNDTYEDDSDDHRARSEEYREKNAVKYGDEKHKQPAAGFYDEDKDRQSDDGNRHSARSRFNQHDRKGKNKVTSVSDNDDSDSDEEGIPEDDDPLCIQKRRSQKNALGKQKHSAAVTDNEAIAFALRRIQLLEQQFDHTEDSIKEIREHEKLRNSKLAPPRKQNDGCTLVHVLERINELEFRFGWIRNSIHEIEEYLGFDTFPYPRLEHRWEGPPPDTFRYHGMTYYDMRPIVVTPTGPAGRPSLVPEPAEKDGRWVVVTREKGSIQDQGEQITIDSGLLRTSREGINRQSAEQPAAVSLAAGPSNDVSVTSISSPAKSPPAAGPFNDISSTAITSSAVPSSPAGPFLANSFTGMSSSTFPARLQHMLDKEPPVLKIVKDVNMFPDQYDATEQTNMVPTTPAAPPTAPAAASITPQSKSPRSLYFVLEDRFQEETDVDMFSDDGHSIVPVPSSTAEDISMEGNNPPVITSDQMEPDIDRPAAVQHDPFGPQKSDIQLHIPNSPLAALTAATALSDEPPPAAQLAANSSLPQLPLLNDVEKRSESVDSTAATALREDPPTAAQLARNSSPPQSQLLNDVDTLLERMITTAPTAVRDCSPIQTSGNAAAVVRVHSPPEATPLPDSRLSHQSEHSVDDMDISVEMEQPAADTIAIYETHLLDNTPPTAVDGEAAPSFSDGAAIVEPILKLIPPTPEKVEPPLASSSSLAAPIPQLDIPTEVRPLRRSPRSRSGTPRP